ncbi:hypothetical protein ACQP1P_32330 [Dactylosporangium sp. CA-052675]|uniref:hypothetical protein n=1 Tax=Dactylosporangium sp. CA-052675 TaxID=3239927 RepID=UPI003D8CCFB6
MTTVERLVHALAHALKLLLEMDRSQIDPDSRIQAIEGVEYEIGQMDADELRHFIDVVDRVASPGSDVGEYLRDVAEALAGISEGSGHPGEMSDFNDKVLAVLLAPCRVLVDLEPPLIDVAAQAAALARLAAEMGRFDSAQRSEVLAAFARREEAEPFDSQFLARMLAQIGWQSIP